MSTPVATTEVVALSRSARRRRRPPALLLAGAVLGLAVLVLAIIAPMLWGARAEALTADIRQGHSGVHLLGTDALGRDVLWRTLVATRLTVEMAALATLIAAAAGTLLGAGIVAVGGPVRAVGARVIDLLLSYPPIIVALAVTTIFSPGRWSVVLAIGLAFCPQFARLTNTLAASVNGREFVGVARLLGVGRGRLLARHILPNIVAPLLVLVSVGFATSVIVMSGLSFLGLSVQQPQYDWGSLLADGLRDLYVNPWEAFGPAVAILLTGLAAGLVGDGLAEYWSPRRGLSRAPRPAVRRSPAEVPDGTGQPDAVAELRGLRIGVPDGPELVHGIDLHIAPGEIVGLVGESGSGKSLTAMALARLTAPPLSWSADTLRVAKADLSDPARRPPSSLAVDVGIVFQDPATSFNPALRIGAQLTETLRVHQGLGRREANARAVAALREVRVSSAERRMRQYPHELSGGMRQRAMIAAALLTRPKLIIADEPTTALDVSVQADVLRLLKQVNRRHGTAILFISHDINVVSALCDRVYVMNAGEMVEELDVADLRRREVRHDYTRTLLAATLTPVIPA